MGNACSSVGCSENSQIQDKPLEEQLEKDRIKHMNDKEINPQIFNKLNQKFINTNLGENQNNKNVKGNRVLMFVKQIPTKLVDEKIKQQLNNENLLAYSNRNNNFIYKDDSQCKILMKSKSDFDAVLESDRKLFSKSLVGKGSAKNKYGIDPFSTKKNLKKSNYLTFEKTNDNKNNNNDIIFIYDKDITKNDKKYNRDNLVDDNINQKDHAITVDNSKQALTNKKRVISKSEHKNKINVENKNDTNKENDENSTKIAKSQKNNFINAIEDNKLQKKIFNSNSRYQNDEKDNEREKKNNIVSLEQFLNARYDRKIPNKDNTKIPTCIKSNELDINDIYEKESTNNKISELSLEILKYEKRKNENINKSIEMCNGSIIDNTNAVSFYMKNKNFEKPDDILLSCANSLIDDKDKSIINIDSIRKTREKLLITENIDVNENEIKSPSNHYYSKDNKRVLKNSNLKRSESNIIKSLNNKNNNDIAIDSHANNINILKNEYLNEKKTDSKIGKDFDKLSEVKKKEGSSQTRNIKYRSSSFSKKINEKLSNKPVWTINPKIFEDEKLMEFIKDPFFNHYN